MAVRDSESYHRGLRLLSFSENGSAGRWPGYIRANAGIDTSTSTSEGEITLLPQDPDHSAAEIHDYLGERSRSPVRRHCVGQLWLSLAESLVNVALGVAEMKPVLDYRRQKGPVVMNRNVQPIDWDKFRLALPAS